MGNKKTIRGREMKENQNQLVQKLGRMYAKQTSHKPIWQKDVSFSPTEKKYISKHQLLMRFQNMYQLTEKGVQYYHYQQLTKELGLTVLSQQIYVLYEVLYHFPGITIREWATKSNYIREQVYQFSCRPIHKKNIIKTKGSVHNSPWTYSLSPQASKAFQRYLDASGQGNLENGK